MFVSNTSRAITTLRSARPLARTIVTFHRAMATVARHQPHWQAPPASDTAAQLPPLKIWNSLTRSKELFVPINYKERAISWYACGPTVYDDAHLGHARNYVTTDIIRRILRDYFKFNVKFVMNMTDVDDKIILRGRQQYLLTDFISKNSESESNNVVLETGRAALKAYLLKNLPLIPSDLIPSELEGATKSHYGTVLKGGSLGEGPPGDKEAKVKMHLNTVTAAANALSALERNAIQLEGFYKQAQDVLLPHLDSLHGAFINADDHSIFTKLTQTYEGRFMEDMRNLNCLDPDHITRVTEYGPQIVKFVERIQQNGFAYTTSDGSVYFDINSFEGANNHYARLEPWNRGDKELQADGEGSLTKKTNEKKSDADFALWKSSKPGEPSWPSPWGKGRPGWHIECSAMASDVLGDHMDIHSGGIDLAFPHHDNELAQSEAYWLDRNHAHEHQWVNYFLHMGHLSIQGSKMSKSLKNFTTIREALARGAWTPRSLRIVFLYGGWREGIEVTDDVVSQGASWEEKLNNFFIQANDVLRRRQDTAVAGNTSGDSEMVKALEDASKQVFDLLCDSFNTREVMKTISELTTSFFAADKTQLSTGVVRSVALWITTIVNTLGLNGSTPCHSEQIGWSGISIPDPAVQFVYPLSEIRDVLRRKARAPEGLEAEDLEVKKLSPTTSSGVNVGTNPYAKVMSAFATEVESLSGSINLSKEVLLLCDRVRDVDLFDLGVYLEDRDGDQPALVRPVTKDLLAARLEREEREKQKVKIRSEERKKAAAKAEQGRQSHSDMFRTTEYTAWDEEGVPTKDANGEELTKSRTKKLRKDWERQKKAHEAWKKAQD